MEQQIFRSQSGLSKIVIVVFSNTNVHIYICKYLEIGIQLIALHIMYFITIYVNTKTSAWYYTSVTFAIIAENEF